MPIYGVTADGDLLRTEDDLPVQVDANTWVTLDFNLNVTIQQHDGRQVVTVADPEALTRAMAKVILVREEKMANDTRPMLDEQRNAIFAALTGLFGKLSDAERLRKVSVFAGRKITSMSRRGNMTRADAHRVLDILSEMSDF